MRCHKSLLRVVALKHEHASESPGVLFKTGISDSGSLD